MRFTPNHGWPVAEDGDVVKQYPVNVDQPFKDALDLFAETSADPVNAYQANFSIGPYAIEAYSAVVTTDGAGVANVIFVKPFATSVLVVVATMGGITVPGAYLIVDGAIASPSSFLATVYLPGGGTAAGTAVRINYFAIGH